MPAIHKTSVGNQLPWQTVVLEGIARGAALESTLNQLALLIESEVPGCLCGICVISPREKIVITSLGPHLPESFRNAFVGLSLADSTVSPCAAAVDQQGTVIVSDITVDPRWSGNLWQKLAREGGFSSCRATAIIGSDGIALGALTFYSDKPSKMDFETSSETASNLASIAIERHQDEEALRESEQRLRLVIDGADLGTWDWNLTTGELAWSDRCKEIFGYPAETTMTHGLFLKAIHPEDRSLVEGAVNDALAGRTAYNVEFRVRPTEGAIRWVSSIGSGFSNDGRGRPLSMRGVAMDITQRKEGESLLAESAARFQFLAESLPEKIFTADAKGEVSYLNQKWADYTGLTVQQVMGLGWREFVHNEDIEEKMANWTRAIADGGPFEFEHRFLRADGTYRWHLSRAQPLKRPDGTTDMWIGSNVDVDDLKQAELKLREMEGRSRLALQAAGLGFWDWDMENKMTWSPEHNRMFGIDPHIEHGTHEEVMQRIHPYDRSVVAQTMERALLERIDFEVEFRTIGDDDVVRWITSHGRAFYDEHSGRPVRMIGMVREVTERKHFEERLRSKQEELRSALAAAELTREEAEAANRAKDQFLAVLSHELRTPLTPVLLAVSHMQRDKKLPPSVHTALQMIQRNIKLEARLIEDLLDLTRISHNKMELNLESMDLHLVVNQALEICETDLLAKKLNLHLELAASNAHVMGDQARLQQVFWNIIQNAVKFTPENGTISIRSSNNGPNITVEIKDSGLGISSDILPLIFNPFEQGDKRVIGQFGGLGLGLAISKATIDAHNGSLHAQSAGQNLGATFVVELASFSS